MSVKKQVFISYATPDKVIAFQVCRTFEERGISCWIAPRDVPPGGRYPGEITKAIENCMALILIFSDHAMKSRAVLTEVEMAFHRVPIFPLKTTDSQPNEDFRFLIGIWQWHEALDPSREKQIGELADFVLKSISGGRTAPAPSQARPTAAAHIEACILPFAIAFNNLKEQEINENSDGIDTAVFRIVNLCIRFSVFCLISAHRILQTDENNPDVIKVLTEIAQPDSRQWCRILFRLATLLENNNSLPDFLQHYVRFLLTNQTSLAALKKVNDVVRPKLGSFQQEFDYQKTPVLAFLTTAVHYAHQCQYEGKKIEHAGSQIKNAMVEFIYECGPIFRQTLAAVASVRPNKTEKTVEHDIVIMQGLIPKHITKPLVTPAGDFIERKHVVLFDKEKPGDRLDLYPFLISSEDLTDILLWNGFAGCEKVYYEKLRDRSIIEQSLDTSDPFLSKVLGIASGKEHNKSAARRIASGEDVWKACATTEEFIDKNVTNPLCKKEFRAKVTSIKEHFEAAFQKEPGNDFGIWIEKLDQIRCDATKGTFSKLRPTDNDGILTDEYGGRYIIPDIFCAAHPSLKDDSLVLAKALGKEISSELKAVFWFAQEEALHGKEFSVIGVEHIAIALSKICSRLVFDWYDSLGIPPKYHRDLIRMGIEAIASQHVEGVRIGNIVVKNRLKRVLTMASTEANLAKRDRVSLQDVFSAVLREGYSLPMIILTEILDLTRDRLLSQFYRLLYKI